MLAFPMGIRTFARWAEMVAWINLWPPVYAVLNFILQSAAKSRSEQILKFQETWTGLGGAGKGLSLATATPLANLYTDMVAYAGWASLFVPVLAYMILKGGMSSFVHIAGNMLQASQGAAGAAAQEQVTGNYSYGNVSMGNTQYNTAQMNQHGLSARFSDGYMQESTGHYDMTYTPEGSVMDQKVSHLPVNFSVGQSLSNGYQRRAESALISAYSEGAQMNQTWDQAYREMASFDQHMGQHSGMNSGQSMGIDTSTQQSMQTVMSQAQTFAKKYGVEESRAMSYLAGLSGTASIGGNLGPVALSASANLGANYSGSASKQQMIEDAISIATSKDFTESMSQLKRFSQNTDFSDGQDIGKRLSETLSTTFDRSDHLSKSIGQHLSASENYSKSASYARDNSARMDQNYNDEMWQGFVRHVGGNASEAASIYNSKEGWAREIVDDFNAKYFQRMEHQLMKQSEPGLASDSGFHAATSTMAKHHDAVVDKMKAPSHAMFESERDSLKETSALGGVGQHIQNQRSALQQKDATAGNRVQEALDTQDNSLKQSKTKIKQELNDQDSQWIGRRAARGFAWWNNKKPSDDE
jgi:conjugal transfer mating pair stabilization protein TraG